MTSERHRQNISRETDLWSRVLDFWLSSLEKDAVARETQSPKAELTVISTATVFGTTIVQTTFITVRVTTSTRNASSSTQLTSSCKLCEVSSFSDHIQFPTESTTIPDESWTPAAPPSRTTLHNNTSTLTSPAEWTPTTMPTDRASSNAPDSSKDSLLGAHDNEQPSRRAIIGGLSGSIAGLLLVGVIICLFLRRRRRKQQSQDHRYWADHDEKHDFLRPAPQLPPVIPARSHSPVTVDRPPTSPPAVDEDHRIIRMSTQHWPRPYAPGGAEGHRYSRSTTQLRVMNPDASRPQTPQARPSTDTTRTYLSRKRSALTDVLQGAATRLKASSLRSEFSSPAPPVPMLPSKTRPNRDKPLPIIKVIDRNLSRECIARNSPATSYTPSFRSYPSTIRPQRSPPVATRSPTINYIPPSPISSDGYPQDPFKTPSLETPKPQRPALATLQSAATSVTSKIWPISVQKVRKSTPRIGSRGSPRPSNLTPSSRHHSSQRQSQARKDVSLRGHSDVSVSTITSGPWSARSDPFDLDRGSWRGGRGSLGFGAMTEAQAGGKGGGGVKDERSGGLRKGVYEGT